jgi:regulatory protein
MDKSEKNTGLSLEAALNRAERLCAGREVASRDMEHKLLSWGLTGADVQKLMLRLHKDGFVDDRRYAAAAVRDKYRLNKWGVYKIRQFLRMKGIADQLAEEALKEINRDEYRLLMEKEILAKNKNLKASGPFDRKAKLLRYAQSKGFEIESALEIIERITG